MARGTLGGQAVRIPHGAVIEHPGAAVMARGRAGVGLLLTREAGLLRIGLVFLDRAACGGEQRYQTHEEELGSDGSHERLPVRSARCTLSQPTDMDPRGGGAVRREKVRGMSALARHL